MSVKFVGVQWNRHKIIYDLVLVGFIVAYIGLFLAITWMRGPDSHRISTPIALGRAFGTCAIILLHVILCIGPLARISPRFAPLLYNRRHMGVAAFVLMVAHGFVLTALYHSLHPIDPFVTLLAGNQNYQSLSAFPFQILGLLALIIFFLMAATSHDFWQSVLSARVWKSIHMLVYVAYALIVGHIALGILQSEPAPIYAVLLALGMVTVIGLHLYAGARERAVDQAGLSATVEVPGHDDDDGDDDGGDGDSERWVDACGTSELAMNRGKVGPIAGHGRIAIFRHEGGISAVTNRCAHQGGPLGEGRVIDGCITCPWHGWQYRPADGCSPPPFTERIPTYRVRVQHGRVLVAPRPLAPGTPVPPAQTEQAPPAQAEQAATEDGEDA